MQIASVCGQDCLAILILFSKSMNYSMGRLDVEGSKVLGSSKWWSAYPMNIVISNLFPVYVRIIDS